jgi:hypothetical protein
MKKKETLKCKPKIQISSSKGQEQTEVISKTWENKRQENCRKDREEKWKKAKNAKQNEPKKKLGEEGIIGNRKVCVYAHHFSQKVRCGKGVVS